jgi:CrcB protein
VQARHDAVFPWGTFLVNVTGSALLGFLAALPAHAATATVAGTALCGAFTTYSTFSYETLKLTEDAWLLASLNATASIIIALGAAYAGLAIARALRSHRPLQAARSPLAPTRQRAGKSRASSPVCRRATSGPQSSESDAGWFLSTLRHFLRAAPGHASVTTGVPGSLVGVDLATST